ncbi:MAG: hypothetical protein ACPG7U_03765 [Holosporaceae bacterium]
MIDAGSSEFEYTGTYQKRARREKPLGNRITFSGKYELLDHEEWEKEIESRQRHMEDTSHNQDVNLSQVPRVRPSSSQESTSVESLSDTEKRSAQPASTDNEPPINAAPKGLKRPATDEPPNQPYSKKARVGETKSEQDSFAIPVASAAEPTQAATTYKDNLVGNIRGFLPAFEDAQSNAPYKSIIQTIFVSHPDTDHYNWIPEIVDESVKVNNIVLSGYKNQYTQVFRDWLQKTLTPQRTKIIFTGTNEVDGQQNPKGLQQNNEGYARPYYSDMKGERTPLERAIEEALRVETEGNIGARIKILAMNTHHAPAVEAGKPMRIANARKNASSTVLRLETFLVENAEASAQSHLSQNKSFLFPGDAVEETWNHIKSNYDQEDHLWQADYMVVSHHGSRADKATSKEILDLIQPKACFISAGRHNQCFHPALSTIKLLRKTESLWKTDRHNFIYFKNKRQKMIETENAIFSTFSSGVTHVDMQPTTPYIVNIEHDKHKTYFVNHPETEKLWGQFWLDRRYVYDSSQVTGLKHCFWARNSGTRELVVQAPQSDIFTHSYDDDTYTHFLATDSGNQVLVPVIDIVEQSAPESEESPDADAAEVEQDVGKMLLSKIPAAGGEENLP